MFPSASTGGNSCSWSQPSNHPQQGVLLDSFSLDTHIVPRSRPWLNGPKSVYTHHLDLQKRPYAKLRVDHGFLPPPTMSLYWPFSYPLARTRWALTIFLHQCAPLRRTLRTPSISVPRCRTMHAHPNPHCAPLTPLLSIVGQCTLRGLWRSSASFYVYETTWHRRLGMGRRGRWKADLPNYARCWGLMPSLASQHVLSSIFTPNSACSARLQTMVSSQLRRAPWPSVPPRQPRGPRCSPLALIPTGAVCYSDQSACPLIRARSSPAFHP